MLGFHSQNVLQILENMKPIIFRINVTDEGEITFNKVEGMTNSQAYELMLRNGYGKEGDEPDSFKKSKYFRRNSHRRVSLLPLDFDNQKLTIKVNNFGIQMPTDDQVQIIDYITIYADGDLDIKLLDRQ